MSETDPTTEAVRAVREATKKLEQQLPADLEEAWMIWSKSIKNVDERGMTLLRAAFEAGYEAGVIGGAAATGREGGKKGGQARAKALTPSQRSQIAKKAAKTRWSKQE